MVSSINIPKALPEFFRPEEVVEDILESDDDHMEETTSPIELVQFFEGIRTDQMNDRLDTFEREDFGLTNTIFSNEFTERYLPSTFRHLLYRLNIILNIFKIFICK